MATLIWSGSSVMQPPDLQGTAYIHDIHGVPLVDHGMILIVPEAKPGGVTITDSNYRLCVGYPCPVGLSARLATVIPQRRETPRLPCPALGE